MGGAPGHRGGADAPPLGVVPARTALAGRLARGRPRADGAARQRPATVAALSRIEDPHSRIATGSRGCHALVRTLPVAVAGPHWTEQAGEFAALTHGDPAARSAAERAAVLLRHCLTAPRPDGPGDRGAHRARGPGEGARRPALRRGAGGGRDGAPVRRRPARPARPAGPARPGRDGPSALLGGLYTAASFPGRDRFRAALEFAAGAPDGESAACVTGALLGAVHGAEALPADLVSRHELAWVLDTLARDLLAQIEDSPSGSEYTPPGTRTGGTATPAGEPLRRPRSSERARRPPSAQPFLRRPVPAVSSSADRAEVTQAATRTPASPEPNMPAATSARNTPADCVPVPGGIGPAVHGRRRGTHRRSSSAVAASAASRESTRNHSGAWCRPVRRRRSR
ncbi:ADP-ribosylglycohydrolase family protein [Streptomyces nogalater]